MGLQAILAPGLVLCGALLYGSNFVLATGASHHRRVCTLVLYPSDPRVVVGKLAFWRSLLVRMVEEQALICWHAKADVSELLALPVASSDLAQELSSEVCAY